MRTAFVRLLLPVLVACLLAPVAASEGLMDPTSLDDQAPDEFAVKFETSKGEFTVTVKREWAPNGADRFYNLVQNGFYDDVRFFRVVPGFVVQFGMNGDPQIGKAWEKATIKDDPVSQSNKTGTVSFAAKRAPNSRTTQVFINLKDNSALLDGMGFSPFGVVSDGQAVVSQLYGGYGDGPPRGRGPNQGQIAINGNAYLDEQFPKLDRIIKATVVQQGSGGGERTSE